MAKIATPLRYPGGKSSLAGFIKLIFAQNGLMDGEYVEPYCGGAGVAMELLRSEFAGRVRLNDVDPAVHAFWWSVFYETDRLCERIRTAQLTVDNWRVQRAIVLGPANCSKSDLGFAAFFLNRVNRSGILSAGPIGGLHQSGDWDMGARFNRVALVSMIERLSQYADRVVITSEDAVSFIQKTVKTLPAKSLIYLDPPYVVKGQRLYLNSYGEEDHVEIARRIQSVRHVPWVVSYDNVELIGLLYEQRRTITYDIGYSASRRSVGSEIAIFSDDLKLPEVESPVSIRGSRLRRLLAA